MARSTFASEKTKNTSASDHFWKLSCRKSARHCGAKHISKLKCEKHQGFGPLLDVQMALLRGRRKGLGTLSKVFKSSIFNYNHHTLHYTTLHYTTLTTTTTTTTTTTITILHYTTLHDTTLITLHSTTLH